MSKVLLLLSLLLILSLGCAQRGIAPTPTPTPTPQVTPTPTLPPTPPALPLVVTEPLDESVVSTRVLPVRGTTSPDAVVSVNGELVEVDDKGGFATTVTLEEEINTIEVVASDYEGNEAFVILTVIYIP